MPTCRQCGSSFEKRPGPGRIPRECYSCRDHGSACVDCGGPKGDARAIRCLKCRAAQRARPHDHVCEACGKKYHNKRGRLDEGARACSRECGFVVQARDRAAQARARFDWAGLQRRALESVRTCRICEQKFIGRGCNVVMCSDECRAEDARRAHRENGYGLVDRTLRPCLWCGTEFMAPISGAYSFCSKRCGIRSFRSGRRARKRGQWRSPVRRAWIIQRDRHQCQLCGFMVRESDGPLWRASMDHIVPAERGGLHHEDNVQLAHFMCNSIKGNSREGWREKLMHRLRTDSPWSSLLLTPEEVGACAATA